jgi:hypothetical protein
MKLIAFLAFLLLLFFFFLLFPPPEKPPFSFSDYYTEPMRSASLNPMGDSVPPFPFLNHIDV